MGDFKNCFFSVSQEKFLTKNTFLISCLKKFTRTHKHTNTTCISTLDSLLKNSLLNAEKQTKNNYENFVKIKLHENQQNSLSFQMAVLRPARSFLFFLKLAYAEAILFFFAGLNEWAIVV